ncbi:hypothetical protein EsH8_VI_000833 [Colletotrichum jinshuiense]
MMGPVTVASRQPPIADEEPPEYLPYPATKLIIAQYWHCSRDPPFWGYLIVGTFYDRHNNTVWSTEIFAFQRDTRGDRDGLSVASSDRDPNPSVDLEDQFSRSLDLAQNTSPAFSAYAPSQDSPPISSQHLWDPLLAGPVPGHWVTEFDYRLGNWVNTWQPRRAHP